MELGLEGYDSTAEVFQVYKVYAFVISITYFVLIYDWLANLGNEYFMVIKPQSGNNTGIARLLSLKPVFLASRYITLAWSTFVVATWASASSNNSICSWFKYYPYGYSVAFLPAHLLMIMRIHSIYGRPTKMLYGLLGLALVDFAIQMGVNHLATSVLLTSASPNFAICFTYPTTAVFSLVFISPTIFHHILLVLTLWKSVKQLRTSKSFGITPILQVIQRDHILYTLAICLTNFTNLVLVLQPNAWPYKLIMQLPALMFTQIFLSRIVFSLKATQIQVTSGHKSGLSNDSGRLESGNTNGSSSAQEKRSGGTGGTGSTLVESQTGSGTGSKDFKTGEKGFKTPPSSQRKMSQSYGFASRSTLNDYDSQSYQAHRRGSSATLGANGSSGTEYRFPANNSMLQQQQNESGVQSIPTTQLPPFSSMPLRYAGYRQQGQQRKGSVGSRGRPSREMNEVEITRFQQIEDSYPSSLPREEEEEEETGGNKPKSAVSQEIVDLKAALAESPPNAAGRGSLSDAGQINHSHSRSDGQPASPTLGLYPRSAIPVYAPEYITTTAQGSSEYSNTNTASYLTAHQPTEDETARAL